MMLGVVLKKLLSQIVRIVPEAKKGWMHGIWLSVVYEALKFLPAILLKYVVDHFATGASTSMILVYIVLGIAASYVILSIMDYFTQRWRQKWLFKFEVLVLEKVKRKLLELDIEFHESYNTGSQVSRIVKGTQKLTDLIFFIFEEFLPTFVQLFITVILLIKEQWILAGIFCFFMPIIFWITTYEVRKVAPMRKKYHETYDEAIGELGESLLNISTVKDYVQEEHQYSKFKRLLKTYYDQAQKRFIFTHKVLFFRDMMIVIGRGVTLATCVYMVSRGILSPGSLVLVYTMTERAFLSTHRIGRLFFFLGDSTESINKLAELIDRKTKNVDLAGAVGVERIDRPIIFSHVSFSYGKGKEVLHDVSFSIAPGETVAFVGHSGSGKSTLVKLLLRQYNTTKGDILLGKTSVNELKRADFKRRIAVVSQNVEIFNRSVLENIRFSVPTASKKEVIEAARKAYAHGFISEFEKGYNTLVGEKGVKLSGGQKQRISIARALLADPEVIIFDEATSSLDSESERVIQESIFSIATRKTTVMVAHRLSTIRRADKIIVLDKGKIVEQGTYESLVGLKGVFYRMVQIQNGGELRK